MTEENSKIPQDRETEEAVIGAVLINPSIYLDLSFLNIKDFYIHRHQWIWEAFSDLSKKNIPIDYLTVCQQMEDENKLKEIGGPAYITSLINQTPTSLHALAYAKKIKELSGKRSLLNIANVIAQGAYNGKTVKEIRELAIGEMSRLKPIEEINLKTRWSLAELNSIDFAEPTGPIPGIIPIGLTLLGGRPKRGKSWFMLQAGCTVAIGGKFFNQDLEINKVLYYALEDPPRRLKSRTDMLNIDSSGLIDFDQSLKPLHLGGLVDIANAAKEYKMIIIDTLRRAMPGKDFNKDGALFDDILSQVQEISQKENISIVVILHTRKMTAGIDPDPVDDILGSTGLSASPDCILAIYKDNNSTDARLLGRQRDGENLDLTIYFDPVTCTWQLKGDTDKVKITEDEIIIINALKDLGKSSAAQVAQAIGKNRSNTSNRLQNLWGRGKVKKELINNVAHYYLDDTEINNNQNNNKNNNKLFTPSTQPTQVTQDKLMP